jgi:predicted component of type VI protein secretion system
LAVEGKAVIQMAKLVIRTGSQMGAEFPADRAVIRLGRGSGNDVILQDSQASRQHAEISRQGDQFVIRDLGSTNGTYVNDERVVGSRPLRPGDRVRIGDTILAYESGFAAAAAPAVATDWEAELWRDEAAPSPAAGRQRALLWGLGGVVAVLLIALAVVAVLTLKKPTTPAAVVMQPTSAPTSAIVVAPTATETTASGAQALPTDTSLVELPTVELKDTVAVQATVPLVKVPTVKPPAVSSSVPQGTQALEQLPAIVAQAFPGVPADQLPQAVAQQMQSMSPQELQGMIGALFPGVDPAQLPAVVAASFPEMPQSQIQGLLQIAFPGQTFQLPQTGGPVGGRLAMGIWNSNDEHDYGLYLANAMGGQPVLVIDGGSAPSFASDGQWLVYNSGSPDRLGLRLIKIDGSDDTSLTTIWTDYNPFFSPDGQRILFYNYDNQTLHTINRDGSDRRDIGKGEYPAWSPDGKQIVYRGCVGGGKCGLIVANADGSNPRQITTHANDAAARWSPNGGQIVFHSDRDGNWEIYVINSDGSWLRRITNNPTTDLNPVWSPDGLRVAFRSDRGGKWGVWATSGVGGPASKLFDAGFAGGHWQWGQMDWGK